MKSKKAIHRLKYLIDINKVVFVAIMEPFIDKNKIEGYKRFLGFQHGVTNPSGQIWCFCNSQCDPIVIAEDDQQITLNIKDNMQDKGLYVTAIYAKCTTMERKDLWSSIVDINLLIDGPWCIGGDFNVIMDPEEKLGGKPHRAYKFFDFITTMEACGFSDISFTGPRFTWCNNRGLRKRI
ncbi:uncharacterized protein [Nicotiana sylvestris]|uniref:uncharacterized protein n=1 Tax=Nicotiana sylvestris TaxID=4096 RepID=UPI00388C6C32